MTQVAPFPPVDGSQPCREVDPEVFFPKYTDPEFAEPAIALCRRCVFLHECLAYALTHDVEGVWGGTTDRQRQQLRERHNLTDVEPLVRGPFDTYAQRNAALIKQLRQGGGLDLTWQTHSA